jgi:hypothetical protein
MMVVALLSVGVSQLPLLNFMDYTSENPAGTEDKYIL